MEDRSHRIAIMDLWMPLLPILFTGGVGGTASAERRKTAALDASRETLAIVSVAGVYEALAVSVVSPFGTPLPLTWNSVTSVGVSRWAASTSVSKTLSKKTEKPSVRSGTYGHNFEKEFSDHPGTRVSVD